MKSVMGVALVCAVLGFTLSGCATVFEGTSQEISVVSNPEGATCVFERQGMEVGRVQATPGTANVRKSKYDLLIKCDKPGYAEATYLNHSGTTSTIAANVAADLLLTGGLSSIVDSADGADNKYDSAVNVSLTPLYAMGAQPVPYTQALQPYAPASQAPQALPASLTTDSVPVNAPHPLQPASAAQASLAAADSVPVCTKEDIDLARYAQANGYHLQTTCR